MEKHKKYKCTSCNKKYFFPIADENLFLCNTCLKDEYRNDLSLSRHSLDEHAEGQHDKFEKWHSAYIEIKDICSQILLDLSRSKAELDSLIRMTPIEDLPEIYGIPKITEGSVANTIERNEEIIELTDYQRQALKRRDILYGAVETFRERANMIVVLMNLYKSQYFERNFVDNDTMDKIAEEVKLPNYKKGKKK